MENHKINQSLKKKNTSSSGSKFGLGPNNPHIKNFETLVPRYKCGD